MLSRAKPDDMPAIVDVFYNSFPPHLNALLMGCRGPEDKPKALQLYLDEMKTDPTVIWIQVRDTQSNDLVAASMWRVFMNGQHPHHDDQPSPWLEGEQHANAKYIIDGQNAQRRKAMPGPFVYLHICFTDAKYRRRGAGSMMMKWGVELMDLLFLPGYIEASEEGNFLYRAFGFYDYERIDLRQLQGMSMKRDARTEGVTVDTCAS